jgi:hypothetical protein
MRKLILSCLGCLALTLIVLAPSASAESFAACKWRSTANFTPGLTTSSQPFLYTFRGQLLECLNESGTDFGSGNIEAGRTKFEKVINSTTGLEDEVRYREPIPSGSGGCGSMTTSGTALVSWPSEGHTVISYSTTGGRASVLSGNVVESMTLTAENAKPGDPTTFTITTNQFAGDVLHGVLRVEPEELTACTTPIGATTGGFSGEVAIGTP